METASFISAGSFFFDREILFVQDPDSKKFDVDSIRFDLLSEGKRFGVDVSFFVLPLVARREKKTLRKYGAEDAEKNVNTICFCRTLVKRQPAPKVPVGFLWGDWRNWKHRRSTSGVPLVSPKNYFDTKSFTSIEKFDGPCMFNLDPKSTTSIRINSTSIQRWEKDFEVIKNTFPTFWDLVSWTLSPLAQTLLCVFYLLTNIFCPVVSFFFLQNKTKNAKDVTLRQHVSM